MVKSYSEVLLSNKGVSPKILKGLSGAPAVGGTSTDDSCFSSTRLVGTYSPAKVTGIALSVDSLLIDAEIKAGALDGGKTILIKRTQANGTTNACKYSHGSAVFTGEEDDVLLCTAMLCCELANCTPPSPVMEYYEAAKQVASPAGKNKSSNARKVIALCDYFNQDSRYKEGSLNISPKGLPEEEVQRAIDAGGLQKIADISPFRSTFAVKTENGKGASQSDLLKQAKAGKFLVNHQFPEAMKKYIVPLSFLDSFVATTSYKMLMAIVQNEMSKGVTAIDMGVEGYSSLMRNILMYGDPAGGKTVTWKAVAASLGVPYVAVAGHKFTEEDTVAGKVINQGGEFICVDTPFLEVFRNGGIVVLEEFNLWNPNIAMGALGQAMEAPEVVMKNGLEVVHRHPLCIIGANINVGTRGSNGFNEALQTRFRAAVKVNPPTKKQFVDIIIKDYPEQKDLGGYIYDFYAELVDLLEHPAKASARLDEDECEEVRKIISLRACQGAMALACLPGGYLTVKEAIEATFVGQIEVKASSAIVSAVQALLEGFKDF